MKYEKPEVVVVNSALVAIRGTDKTELDIVDNQVTHQRSSMNAYAADE